MAVLTELTFQQEEILLRLVNCNCSDLLTIALCCSFNLFFYFFIFLSPDLTSLSSTAPPHSGRLQHTLLAAPSLVPDLVLSDANKLTEGAGCSIAQLTPMLYLVCLWHCPGERLRTANSLITTWVTLTKPARLKAKINLFFFLTWSLQPVTNHQTVNIASQIHTNTSFSNSVTVNDQAG